MLISLIFTRKNKMELNKFFTSSNKINQFISSFSDNKSNCNVMEFKLKPKIANNHTSSVNNVKTDDFSNSPKFLHYECLEVMDAPQKCVEKHSNFTIDYILGTHEKRDQNLNTAKTQYDWLHYTRYRPPKLQRIRKKENVQKRRLGRNPRIPFSNEQVTILEEKFQISPYLSNSDVMDLSKCLQLSESRIKIWFQNRRARERRDSNDSSEKGLNLIKSFLMKTRHTDSISDDVQDLSMSAFRPCHNAGK